MKRTLFWRIFGGFAIVILVLAGAIAVFGPRAMRSRFLDEQTRDLREIGGMAAGDALRWLDRPADLQTFAAAAGRSSEARITVVNGAGVVLADSEGDPGTMENHRYRPEIQAALEGRVERAIRASPTLGSEMLYLGIPLRRNGGVAAVLRVSRLMSDLNGLFAGLRRDLVELLLFITPAALLAALLLTRSVTGPIREFVDVSGRVAGGDFEIRLPDWRSGEFRAFARSFNTMASGLQGMFRNLRDQKEELDSILSSIRDGLCIIDEDDRIVSCNPGFRALAEAGPPEGRYYWEVIRSTGVLDMLRTVRQTRASHQGEVVIREKIYLCRAVYLAGQDRRVVTLQDMTEFRNLERIKKDFVLNVSHELKTPLTSIKGFTEMLEGQADEEARRYLGIIGRNTDRLIAIVEDLLTLSVLEEKGTRLIKEPVDLAVHAENTVRLVEAKARARGLTVRVEAAAGLPSVPADPFQIDSLLLNLVDNAVKYSETGEVVVRLRSTGDAAVIAVEDTGPGIPEEHLPHIFERFYVVDKGRSKKAGGTGLGLSIVKHIVLAHQGRIEVRSRVGRGTVFTVSLPAAGGEPAKQPAETGPGATKPR